MNNQPAPIQMAKKRIGDLKKLSTVAVMALFLTACASSPKAPPGSEEVRAKLTNLQSNSQLATLAPVAINEAEQAVRLAEKQTKDKELSAHRVALANGKVDIAAATAQTRYLEEQREAISQQRDTARLESRTLEADRARAEAQEARAQVQTAQQQAEEARREAAALKEQMEELNAKQTDRGMVVTLGDVLFATGRAELKSNTANNLDKLASFLNEYTDRTVTIEGHTDSVGDEDYNLGLSQRRADAVKSYLLNQGIANNRINTVGKGEGSPVADNNSATGRQMNRRVEVIIANATNQ